MHKEFENVGNTDVCNRIVEETAELLLAIAKARRFGWFSNWKDDPLNYQQVLTEIQDCRIQFGKLEEEIIKMVSEKEVLEGVPEEPSKWEPTIMTFNIKGSGNQIRISNIEGGLYE